MKRILLIATGGTIASSENGSGLSPTAGGEELVRAVPQLAELAHIDVVQLMNIDSTNMHPASWLHIAQAIHNDYDLYDGFVVLHGTDTMAYTAAALSYLVQQSPKPIVLTGSQKPMADSFTDAKLNVYQSVLYACDDLSCDVSVVFGGAVIAGTRARKQRTMSFNAFQSVNFPVLAYVRNNRIVRSAPLAAVRAAQEATRANNVLFYEHLDPKVFVLKLTPGIDSSLFGALEPLCNAVILETFGIGGIPEYAESPSFKQALFQWVAANKTLVITTQVPEEGLDLGVYEVGRAFDEHPGILKGDDMTTEALVAKTMWIRGCASSPEKMSELFYKPINHDRVDGA